MAIKIQFDPIHNPELPIMVLAKRSGEKIGQLDPKSVHLVDDLNNASEISFSVHKYVDGKKVDLWDRITNFKLIWCAEWDTWFEITVDVEEDDKTVKNISCTEICHAELSQIMLYNIEINTETDIARPEYKHPTVLYKPEEPSESLLNRITEKATHYKILHVDESLRNIQRTFTFDGESLLDAFNDICEEIDCLVLFDSSTDKDGKIVRGISFYDLESTCHSCGHRGQYTKKCPKCGSTNIYEGYGVDTKIFIDSEEFANSISLSTDIGSVKNCFKLEGGDDLMTATIRSCNPNGTDYIWYISDALKQEMTDELVDKIEAYDELYQSYQDSHVYTLNSSVISKYNTLIDKYKVYNEKLENIQTPITGYPSLTKIYFNTIDFKVYLESVLMPDAKLSDTSASKELAKLITTSMSSVATTNINYISLATADNIVTQMAKAIVDSRYRVDIENSSLTQKGKIYEWKGVLIITNYSDEEDTATSQEMTLTIDDNYKVYVEQKLQKALHDKETKDLSITGLFEMSQTAFDLELKKYCLNRLLSFRDACQACIDVLIEQDISNQGTWANQDPNMYNEVYVPYRDKLTSLDKEIKLREQEINLIGGVIDNNGNVTQKGLMHYIEEQVVATQKALDYKKYIGDELWKEFISYRREDKYSNSNYISDGLTNAELFEKALEFINVAEKEIYKSAELQHSISTSLKNLLVMKNFEPLLSYFKVGNWIRVMVDDEVYKLRLLKYEIDFDNLENISVDFSDVFKTYDGESDQQSIIARASSMATSYSSTQRQANQGAKSSEKVNDVLENGFDITKTKIINSVYSTGQVQTWDEHGMLFRRRNDFGEYDKVQMKIINSSLVITDDDFKTTKTAIGLFKFVDPVTGELKETYGINGEVIIGKLLLGESLGIYNRSGSLKFNNDGFTVSNGSNIIAINPSSNLLFRIANKDGNVFTFNSDGDLVIVGNITAKSLTLLDDAVVQAQKINGLSSVAVSGSYNDLKDTPILAKVATSGSYNDLKDKPTISYEDIEGTPTLFSGSYNDLTDKPTLFSGNYNDLSNKPTLFSGDYNDLKNKPALFSGSYNDLTNKPNLDDKMDLPENDSGSTVGQYLEKSANGSKWVSLHKIVKSGSYNDLTDKPTLFSGAWNDLSGKPTFAKVATSGSYNDLSNKPTLFSGSYNDLSNKPDLTKKMDVPTNNSSASAGQILCKTDSGSNWIDIDTLKSMLGIE